MLKVKMLNLLRVMGEVEDLRETGREVGAEVLVEEMFEVEVEEILEEMGDMEDLGEVVEVGLVADGVEDNSLVTRAERY